MSANVWFEEVNTALLKEIQNSVRIKDESGILVPLDSKAFIVRKPEEDFKFEVFPCISIYNLNHKFDPSRYNPALIKVGEDIDNNSVIVEEPAIPFNLEYQIDFWADYQTDMDYITRSWLSKHFRQFNLKVVDDGGVERACNCLMKGSGTKSDLVLNGDRLFHTIMRLDIWVELDDQIRYSKFAVVDRDVNIQEKS